MMSKETNPMRMRSASLRQFLLCAAERYHKENRPMLKFCERTAVRSVYAEDLLADVSQAVEHYRRFPQMRIGIVGINTYGWIANALAVMLAGKELIFLDANMPIGDMRNLIRYADVQMLITTEEILPEMKEFDREILVATMFRCKTMEHGADWQKAASAICRETCAEGGFVCFTSGTSRSAKGVQISSGMLAEKVKQEAAYILCDEGECAFIPVPLYHIYGFTAVFYQWARGNVVALGSSPRYFMRELAAMTPHTAWLVPTLLQFLLKYCQCPPGLKRVITAGSLCRSELIRQAQAQGLIYQNVYGLSETIGWVCSSVDGEDPAWLAPYPDIQFLVSESGELGIRMPYLMDGYYKKPEETEQVLNGDLFWTGDAGEVDAQGRARILGRVRDMIVLENGEKIHAGDKDADLMQLPHVADAAVIGLNGEIAAVIVPEDPVYWDKIMTAMNAYNQNYSQIHRIKRTILRTEPLPRTSVGKLRRYLLEQAYQQETAVS